MIRLTAEQAQQIEEVLEFAIRFFDVDHNMRWIGGEQCLASIRAARAQEQAEPEPVAVVGFDTKGWRNLVDALTKLPDGQPLYTHSVRTKDLTDAEIADIGTNCGTSMWSLMFARAIIAADREKNK